MNQFQWRSLSVWQSFKCLLTENYGIIMSPRIPEILAGIFIIVSAVLTYIYGMFLVLPEILENHPSIMLLLLRILGTWVFLGVLSNFYLVRQRTSSIRNRMLIQPIVQPVSSINQSPEMEVRETAKRMGEHFTVTPYGNSKNWHICGVCEVFVPPRTWHCHICNICILRRDHHCIFTGCCIGEENQSNFMGLVFYLAVGTTLSTIFSLIYHLYILDQSFLSFLFRSVVVIYTVVYDFDIKYILSAICFVGHIVSWGVFAYYLYNTLKGQTSADAHRKVYLGTPGCQSVSFKNMREFLGPNPILRILWPFHSPLKVNYGDAPGYKSEDDRKGL